MEVLQMYNDVPAIELGAEDYSTESFPIYAASMELSHYWRSIDPDLNSQRSLDSYPTDTSAHLVNMEKHLLNLANSAYGCGRSPAYHVPNEDSPRVGLSMMWGSGGEALRTMRYMSPNGPLGGSLSSTNSTPSDYAFSPDLSRHHASLFRENLHSPISFGSPYPVPYPQSQYSWVSQGSYSGHVVSSPTPTEQAVACSMKELQYTPDTENEDVLEDSDCIKIETRPPKMAPTPGSCCLAIDTPSRSEYDDSMKDEVEEKSIDSDIDPEYFPSRSQPIRRMSNNKHPARSPTHSRNSFVKPTSGANRVLKSSQRQVISTQTKTKSVPRRRSSNKNGGHRPFICSFSRYGCESRFSSKNEWKRHVSSQHLQLGFYRCDTGTCNPEDHSRSGGTRMFNDFGRKDLFTQHHRRMHTPWTPSNKPPSKKASEEFEEGLEEVRQRCWRERRQAPKRSQCIFCHLRYEGETAWEERMEHIGKHFERAEREKVDLGEGEEDLELRAWALKQGIVVECGDAGCWLDGVQGNRVMGKAVSAATNRRSKVKKAGDVEEDAAGEDE